MGKPTKPRVKGNLKPASSSRAAELAGAGNSLSFENLGGFAQFAGNSAASIVHSRPSTPSSADGYEPISSHDLDPELIVILKKISKRDTITKIKALEELESYLQNNVQAVAVILHNWVAMYGKLVLEVDRRVRLIANQVHTLITTNAKKKLAPLLKEFIGPWMLSMYDQSKDVAKVAQQAFESVFSTEKRLGVMSFCQKEILDYVTDMLLFKTAETLSDVRYVSKEDMMAKYARVVASSFQVVSNLISKLPIEEREKCQAEYDIILDDTTMWKKFSAHQNPLIRKALYQFIRTLLLSWIDMIEDRQDIICPHFYASVFTEKDTSTHSDMWDGFLLMTKKIPSSWLIIGKKKPALPKLYNFLRSGLNGSVNIAYPSMLALLANLPSELKNTPKFYTDIFENFWKGLSTEYIDKANFHIFLNAYAECLVYFSITLSKSEDSASNVSLLIDTIYRMTKVYFLDSRDKTVKEKMDFNSYAILAKHLVVLASVDSVKEYMSPLWTQLDELLVQNIIDCTAADMNNFCQKTGNFLTAISHEMDTATNDKLSTLEALIDDLSRRLLVACIESSVVYKDKSFGLLVLAKQLLNDAEKADGLVYPTQQTLALLMGGPENTTNPLISFYMSFVAQQLKVGNKKESQELWAVLINKIDTMFTTSGYELRGANALVLILEHIQTEHIVLDSSFRNEKFDNIVKVSLLVKLNQVAIVIPRPVLESICALSLKHHLSFSLLSDETAVEVIRTLESNLIEFNTHQFIDTKAHALLEPSVQTLKTTLSSLVILQKVFETSDIATKFIDISPSFICELFDAMFVTTVHDFDEELEEEDEQLALNISLKSSACWELVEKLIQANKTWTKLLLERLRESILNIHYSASPSDSVQRFKKLLAMDQENAMSVVVSTESKWKELAFSCLGQKTNTFLELGITNVYAGISVEELTDDEGELVPVPYDIYGLSSFGRFALFLGEYLATSSSMTFPDWLMRQLVVTSIACEQGLSCPSICRIWESKAIEGVRAFVQSLQQSFSDYLNSLITSCVGNSVSEWNQALLDTVQGKNSSSNRLIDFIAQLMLVKEDDTTLTLSAELLQRTLQKMIVVLNWQVSDLEKWLGLLKPEAHELDLLNKVAVLRALKNELSSTETYKHYQSDLASKLSGVQSFEKLDYDISDPDLKKKANWSVLCLLNASSLKVGAFNIPRQRLMYLMQSIRPLTQRTEDEDYSSEQQKARIQAQWAQLLKHLADSIQDVSGSHWELLVQCCFEWVTFADTTQPEEVLAVYHALTLFRFLYDLADDHEDLESIMKDHMVSMSSSLLKLMAKEEEYLKLHPKDQKYNQVRLMYQTLLSELLESIPETILIDNDYFKNLNVLMKTPNEVLQKRAYLLLKKYIAHRVQDLSVQFEFTETSDEPTKADIDSDVFDALLSPPDLSNWQYGEEGTSSHEVLGYLLTWMLMLDHFTDITFKLKQEYTSQLKEKEAVSFLVPLLCRILSVGQQAMTTKSFDLSPWSILEYDIDGFDMTSEMSFQVLSSHIYYRALKHIPSLIRLWWIDCKQRQLTIAVENYTEKYFSQQLISQEMELVSRPDVKSQLEDNDENEFTIKTSKAANEVTATYRVDEQNMQIAIKLPSNFPLRQIDVEGIAKVGVNDKQWRGWMFAITAVIGSQNGNIVDALTVFKRNVNLHFNGVEDCTICYSIISVQDRSIPTKQCKTCKNKFHSSCLYKWFRSSNSASCPLCRTVF